MQHNVLPNVALIGFMGTGKSLLGQMLAQRWGWRFVDTDSLIEEKVGCSVAQIFERFGEEYFRQQETEVLRSLETQHHLVIATGGGVPTRPENVHSLRRHAVIVLLTAEPEVILQRVQPVQTRPKLASAPDPLAEIRRLLREREVAYACADIRVDTSALSPEEAVQHIEELLQAWKPTSLR
ncbi:MAG: shikimate kinase [Armatimonadota bacterium]|nr:MAG: shikimate kinase [Armatimonadota bacterium]